MHIHTSKIFYCILALLLIFGTISGRCQVKAALLDTAGMETLEAAIKKKQFLQLAQQRTQELMQRSIQSKDDITLARSLNDLMEIRDLRTEDTLYFRNSAFMDTLLNDPRSSAGLKAIMHVLRARRINNFDRRYTRFNAAAYRTQKLQTDYAALSPKQRDSIVSKDLEAAINDNPFKKNINKLLWLSSNPDVFLFEPKFEDIVLSERINLAAGRNYEFNEEISPISEWASLPSERFRYLLDSLSRTTAAHATALNGYYHWLSFNRPNEAVSMFIESLARKYIYLSFPQDSVSRQAYITYLLQSSNSPYAAFKAHSVYQLCLIWNEDGNKYANFYNEYQFRNSNNFDRRYQYMPLKALQLYQQHKELLSKYSLFNSVLGLMAQQILRSGLRIEMEDKFIPGDAIPVKAIYKNSNAMFYRVVRVNPAEPVRDKIKGMAAPELLNRKAVAEGKFDLPLPIDHNNHAVYLKLQPLEMGNYCLLFGNKTLKAKPDTVNSIAFQVTGVTAINSDRRVYVLDRKTGLPLAGAVVRSFKKGLEIAKGMPFKAGQKGYITMPENKADSIAISYRGDTVGQSFTLHANNLSDDIYDKDLDGSLDEFYAGKLSMHVFTDRSIYRPGQTVHFKIIFLTNDPQTGAPILFNSENIGRSVLKNKLKHWLKENKALITLTDPFERQIDSVKLEINEFASFAASFTLPKGAATGDWKIKGGPDADYRNSGEFKVEEYKRPTIELSMDKQKKMLRPGEPFMIKLKLRSFTGADLNDIPIKYTMGRYGNIPYKNSSGISVNDYKNVDIIDSGGHTDKNGELQIAVNDTLLSKYKFGNESVFNYTYKLHATAVDATGESSEVNENINISTRPVRIRINMENVYDRQALPALDVTTTADFEGTVGRQLSVKLYQVTNPDAGGFVSKQVDGWLYPEADWNNWFPKLASAVQGAKVHALVLDTIISTGSYQKFVLPKEKLNTGFYELKAICEDNHMIIGQSDYDFKIFDSKSGESPAGDIDYLAASAIKPGETVSWYSSGKNESYTIYQVLCETESKHRTIKNIYQEINEKNELRRWSCQIPSNAKGTVLLTRVSVGNNQIFRHEKQVFLVQPASEAPEIIVEKYRKVMAPGAQETFTLSVKTKNGNAAAELMTTLYDASLDKLQDHRWNLPATEERPLYLSNNWSYSLTAIKSEGDYGQSEPQSLASGRMADFATDKNLSLLEGKVAGFSVGAASGLGEVVVVGYSLQAKRDIPGSALTVYVRGSSSLSDYKQPLIVLDGQIYTGDLKNIPPATINQIMVLKGADATAIYGAGASQGVLIISTKGPIVLPGAEEAVTKIRKNFNETAFFFPQVHAGADGYYHFSFTMPESATEWNWKMLAHTRSAKFAYLEKKLQTQLCLMVQPNMPRLLYQGDQIKLQSRISNLDTTAVIGKSSCKIEDAVTGKDITTLLLKTSDANFTLDRKSSATVSFMINVPAEQINPIKIVIAAASASASDAEEHTIPVLSSKVFIRRSVPVNFINDRSVTITSVKLPVDATLFGIGFSITQKPQATLINSLPWLAGYSYDCAEQTFNKLRARTIALQLMQKDSFAQAAFKKVSATIENEKPGEKILPDELTGEAMPWLGLGNQATYQQKQLFNLLDTINTKNDINKRLEKLYKMQQADGGLAWFEGGQSNQYISAYVLIGFGQLKNAGWRADRQQRDRHKEFITKLFRYVADQALKEFGQSTCLQTIYALSYWTDSQDNSGQLTAKVKTVLAAQWRSSSNLDLHQQALLIINTFRYTKSEDKLTENAKQQLDNIMQLAINDTENGIRWKAISDSEELGESAEETMALLAEAFALSGKYKDVNSGIVTWLLNAKQDQHWQTTKGTAAAINLLQEQKGSTFGETKSFTALFAQQHLSVSDGLLDGTPAAFAAIKQSPASITLQPQGNNITGAVTWYYFAEPKQPDTLNKSISIKKKFYVLNKDNTWSEFASGHVLTAGDRLRVKLTIETSSRLKFVHISDPRAAAFEPKDNNSGYQYNNGLGYYQSVKDTGLELFAESIPRGISEISYELVVAMSGQFTSGPAKVQCMYVPSATAYSNTQKFLTN